MGGVGGGYSVCVGTDRTIKESRPRTYKGGYFCN